MNYFSLCLVALRLSRDDERECLSQALQSSVVDLVDRLQFNYSTLPDQLISAGHMTEDECRMLRDDITPRKDQVRYLVSRTKCRDLKDIQRFLELIESEVPDVVSKIQSQFEENKQKMLSAQHVHCVSALTMWTLKISWTFCGASGLSQTGSTMKS